MARTFSSIRELETAVMQSIISAKDEISQLLISEAKDTIETHIYSKGMPSVYNRTNQLKNSFVEKDYTLVENGTKLMIRYFAEDTSHTSLIDGGGINDIWAIIEDGAYRLPIFKTGSWFLQPRPIKPALNSMAESNRGKIANIIESKVKSL